jgi:hypothetical protein
MLGLELLIIRHFLHRPKCKQSAKGPGFWESLSLRTTQTRFWIEGPTFRWKVPQKTQAGAVISFSLKIKGGLGASTWESLSWCSGKTRLFREPCSLKFLAWQKTKALTAQHSRGLARRRMWYGPKSNPSLAQEPNLKLTSSQDPQHNTPPLTAVSWTPYRIPHFGTHPCVQYSPSR